MKSKFIPIAIIVVLLAAIPVTVSPIHAQSGNGKYIIFTMDDATAGQYNFAKPVLDTYGYKASFMIVCNWVGGSTRMTWNQIADMGADGQDIESHTMTHPDLNFLSASQLQYEIGGSKQCLQDHGFNPTVFAYPANHGSENATVVNIVSQYYDTAKTLYAHGPEPLWFLACDGYKFPYNQTNCATYTPSGKLQYANQYAVRMNSIDNLEVGYNYNDSAVYNVFVNWMNTQTQYNVNGALVAIPVVTLHDIVSPTTPSYWLHTNQVLFSRIVNYLHDNGFTVLTLKDLGYDTSTNTMYVKAPPPTPTGTILTLNPVSGPYWGASIQLSGKLTDNSGNGLGGKTVTFSGNGSVGFSSAITNSDGTYSATGPASSTVSNGLQVQVNFSGDSSYTAVSATQSYNTVSHSVSLTLGISPSYILSNGTYSLSGRLFDTSNGNALNAMTISFSANPQITIPSTSTNSTGYYIINGLTPNSAGSNQITAQFTGSSLYNAANSTSQTLTVTLPPVPNTNTTLVYAITNWAEGLTHPITDSQLLSDMGLHGSMIPYWEKKTARFVASNDITAQDFSTSINYLYNKQIIR